MARKIDQNLQAIVDLLPQSGEMSYADWRKAVLTNNPDSVRLIHQVRRSGAAVFRLEMDESGNVRHLVSRSAAPR